jgi:thioredoxin reductase
VVIGAGAAGYFSAITCAQANPNNEVILVEKTSKTLQKVLVSGGGRCNVTHACFEPKQLSLNYPRGEKELREAREGRHRIRRVQEQREESARECERAREYKRTQVSVRKHRRAQEREKGRAQESAY